MRSRTVWDTRLKLYPLLALVSALWVGTADRQDGTEASVARPKGNDVNPAVSALPPGYHKGTAIDCFTHPLITLCNRMTQERR